MGRSSVDPFRTSRRERRANERAGDDTIDFVRPRTELFGAGMVGDRPASGFATGATSQASSGGDDDAASGTGTPRVRGTGSDSPFGDPRGSNRSRWMATVAVAALVAMGVLVAAPWRSTRSSSPPSPTRATATPSPITAAPTTRARPSSSGPAATRSGRAQAPEAGTTGDTVDDNSGDTVLVPGTDQTAGQGPLYVLDPADIPGHPTPVGGSRTDVATSPALRTSWVGLWSTPYATRTDGQWVLAEVDRETLGGWPGQDRVDVGLPAGKSIGLHTVSPDGVHRLLVQLGDRTLTLTAHGWDEGALAGLAAQATITDGRATFPASAFPTGEAGLLDEQTIEGLTRTPLRQDSLSAEYFGPRDDEIMVLTAPRDVAWDLIRPLLGSGDGLSTGPTVHHLVGRRDVVVSTLGTVFSGHQYWVAEWTEDGRTIDLVSRRSLAEILALVAKVRPGTDDEWTTIEQTNVSNDDTATTDSSPPTDPTPFTHGTAHDATAWVVSVNTDATLAGVSLPTTSADPAISDDIIQFPLDPADPLRVLAGNELTLVACVLPTAQAPQAMHVVTVDGPIDVPFLPVGTSGQAVAAYAFSELGRYSVHVERSGAAPLDAAYGPGS